MRSFLRLVLCVVALATVVAPARAQSPTTDLGSVVTAPIIANPATPQPADIVPLYRGQNGVAVPSTIARVLNAVPPGITRFVLTGVNFNSANTDNTLSIPLPAGISRWRINQVFVNKASASISTSTIGVFTATGGSGGGGQTIAADQAVTVTATSADTNNNMMALTLSNVSSMAYSDTTIYIRIGTPQGSAATADVIVDINPLS